MKHDAVALYSLVWDVPSPLPSERNRRGLLPPPVQARLTLGRGHSLTETDGIYGRHVMSANGRCTEHIRHFNIATLDFLFKYTCVNSVCKFGVHLYCFSQLKVVSSSCFRFSTVDELVKSNYKHIFSRVSGSGTGIPSEIQVWV